LTSTPAQTIEIAEGDEKNGLDFTVGSPPRARGRVLWPDGTPAAGVLVDLSGMHLPTGRTGAPRVPQRTGPDGKFKLGLGLQEGVLTGNRPLAVVATEAERGLAGYAVLADPALLLEIQLAPAAFLTVQASDPRGQPVAGVHLYGQWQTGGDNSPLLHLLEMVSDAQGHVRIGPLPAGQVWLTVSGYDEYYMGDKGWPAADGWLKLTAGEQALPPLRIDRRGLSVSGSVVDGEGRPVAGAVVAWGESSARTDDHGRFTLSGLPLRGSVFLTAVHPTQELFAGQRAEPGHGEGPPLVLQPLGNLQGQVVNAEGKPLSGVNLTIVPEGGTTMFSAGLPELLAQLRQAAGRPRLVATTNGRVEPGGVTDEAGRWRLEGLIAGAFYTVRVQYAFPGAAFFSDGAYPPVQVKPGGTTDAGQLVFKPQAQPGQEQAAPAPPRPAGGAAGPPPRG
jgi:hypothetical protein